MAFYNGTAENAISNSIMFSFQFEDSVTFGRSAQYAATSQYGVVVAFQRGGHLSVQGALNSEEGSTVEAYTGSPFFSAFISPTGSIVSANGSAVSSYAAKNFVSNAGYISGNAAIALYGATAADEATVINDGIIAAGFAGIRLSGDTGFITNTGTISAIGGAFETGHGMFLQNSGETVITNSGTISGRDYGLYFDDVISGGSRSRWRHRQ